MILAAGSAIVVVAALAVKRREAETAPVPVPVPAPAPAPAPIPVSATAELVAPPTASAEQAAEEGCAIEDRGRGRYREIDPGVLHARLFMPEPFAPATPFDLLVHFHGGEAAIRLLANEPLGDRLLIATIDAGSGSQRYAAMFGPEALDQLRAAVEKAAGAKLAQLTVSAWSAGAGAVRQLLSSAPRAPRAVILLDALHADYRAGGAIDEAGLAPFFDLAQRAATGEQLFVLTHSAITPPGYASTGEVASRLIAKVGGHKRYGGLVSEHGARLAIRFDRGDFHVRGYTGADKAAHCAQLRMLPEILEREVLPFLSRH